MGKAKNDRAGAVFQSLACVKGKDNARIHAFKNTKKLQTNCTQNGGFI